MSGQRQDDRPGRVREVEFTVRDSTYPFVYASAVLDCRIDLAEILPRDDGQYAEFFTVAGVDPSRIGDLAAEHDAVEAHLLSEYEDGGLFEFLASETCPAVTLAELGALPQVVRGVDGTGHIVAEVPPRHDALAIIDAFLEETAEATLAAKRETDRLTLPLSRTVFRRELRSGLTERQREVLEAAFEAGYYDWPRECTGEEVAAELGITSPTFSQHIHAAERTLLTMLFEDERVGPDRSR